MATARYRFRLGDSQSITLRCSPVYGSELRCRVRGRIGRIQWATEAYAGDGEITGFLDALDRLVGNLNGVASLSLVGGGGSRLGLHITVEPRGTILTEYKVAGCSGGLRRTSWQASGSFITHHRHYFTRIGTGTPVAG